MHNYLITSIHLVKTRRNRQHKLVNIHKIEFYSQDSVGYLTHRVKTGLKQEEDKEQRYLHLGFQPITSIRAQPSASCLNGSHVKANFPLGNPKMP